LARAFSVVNIHLMRALEALRCRSQAAISDTSRSWVAMRLSKAFTKMIVEGIEQGNADLEHDGTITTSLLDLFVERGVKELIEGKQNPVMEHPPRRAGLHDRGGSQAMSATTAAQSCLAARTSVTPCRA